MTEKTSRLNGYLRYMEVLEKTSSKAVATKAVMSDTISVTVAVSVTNSHIFYTFVIRGPPDFVRD